MTDYDEDNMWDEDPESPEQDDELEKENMQTIQTQCLRSFGGVDYIMEPGVFNELKRYFSAGGSPEQVVRLLPDNYQAVGQMVNLLAEWLIQAGVPIEEVQALVEDHLRDMILKYFDPKKADSIFTDEGETPSWLAEMIEYPTWRSLFYKLAAQYPDCLMLNFTIKLISDAGHQGEITSVSTACHQIEVFSRVLRTSISNFLEGGDEMMESNITEFTRMVCHGEHTYLYSQLLMYMLSQDAKGGSNVRRLCQEVDASAHSKGLDVTPITLALNGAAAYPRACQALLSMLSRNALNPADITVLYKMYTSADPPVVAMIRSPQFMELFVGALFKPSSKINAEYKAKYVYLLAYASCVIEVWRKGSRKSINKDELKATIQATERAHSLCSEHRGSTELIADVGTLYQCLKYPVVAMGILKWVDCTVSEASYFKLNTDHTPLHLVLLDEISSNHLLLHVKVLELLNRLFESSFDELDVMVRLELKKTILDRMVHLLSRGCIMPVISYIKSCWLKQDTDVSLIRYFVTEVLDVIAPPYTSDFIQLFLPLIENDDITGSLRNEDADDPISSFIGHCKTNYILHS